jgi:hypothetical protein
MERLQDIWGHQELWSWSCASIGGETWLVMSSDTFRAVMCAHETKSAIKGWQGYFSHYLILRDHGCGPNPTLLSSFHRRRVTTPSMSLQTDSPRWPTLSHAKQHALQSSWLSYISDMCGPCMDYHCSITLTEDCSLQHRTCKTYTVPLVLTSGCPWHTIQNHRGRWNPITSGLRRTSRSFLHTDRMIGWTTCTQQSLHTTITSIH